MIEPSTLGLAELAARWNLTPRQVMQHAQDLGVPLYFAFEGLAFDVSDEWHRSTGDWQERREHDTLARTIDAAECQLRRRANGQLSQFEALSSDQAIELRKSVEANKAELERLATLLEQRQTERNRRFFRGMMRAGPSTLWDIDTRGSALFPHKAFHPAHPVKVVTLARQGDGEQIWDGRLMDLEQKPAFRATLTADDLYAVFAEVKAIEAWTQAKPTQTVSAAEAMVSDEAAKSVSPMVCVNKPVQRTAAQDAAILSAIRAAGYDPQALPRIQAGKPGIKKKIRVQMGSRGMWDGPTIFDKAWYRLLGNHDIAYKT